MIYCIAKLEEGNYTVDVLYCNLGLQRVLDNYALGKVSLTYFNGNSVSGYQYRRPLKCILLVNRNIGV